MTDRELLQQALDALEAAYHPDTKAGGVMEAISARLAQPEPESMDWMEDCADFWNRYTYLNERAQEKYDEEAQMWIKKLRENANG